MNWIIWSRGVWRSVAFALSAALMLLVPSACGGGGEEATATAEAGGEAHGSPRAGSKAAAPGVPVSSGDDSIQTWGLEASSAERARLSVIVEDYLNARARADWARACSRLADEQHRMFDRLIGGGSGNAACAEAMGKLAREVPARGFDNEADIRKVLSLRLGGGRGFLIYRRHDGVYATAVIHEGGTWKVVSVSPAVLG